MSSFAITCVLKSNLGAFATTAANVTIGNWLHISIGTAGFLVELIILALVIYLKEGLSITAIVNIKHIIPNVAETTFLFIFLIPS